MTYVTFPSASPLSADIPPGARLDLNPGRQIALRHRTRDALLLRLLAAAAAGASRTAARCGADARDDRRTPRPSIGDSSSLTSSIAPWDRAIARLLVRNSVLWAAQAAAGHDRAVAAGETRRGVDRAGCRERIRERAIRRRLAARGRSAIDVLSHDRARRSATSGCRDRLAESGRNRNARRQPSSARWSAAREQRVRLATTQRELRRIVGSDANGLRPPEEQFDTATMSAWLAAKGNYLFGANDSRSAAPELLRIGPRHAGARGSRRQRRFRRDRAAHAGAATRSRRSFSASTSECARSAVTTC